MKNPKSAPNSNDKKQLQKIPKAISIDVNRATTDENGNQILTFLEAKSSFEYKVIQNEVCISQIEDNRNIKFKLQDVEKVLERLDYDGSSFLQVNFNNGLKVLITKNLVGFKPTEINGFDSSKIPKVVTTVDLLSIAKAIEDLSDEDDDQDGNYNSLTELEVLKRVYQSILLGASAVGFDMQKEKAWFANFLLNTTAASA